MAKTKRVFEIAKELDVESKAIVAKCQAEGLDIKNHMSAVSVGLAQTIREWFSEGAAGGTAVETAQKVDLTKARKAKARKRAKPAEAEPETEEPTVEKAPPAKSQAEQKAPPAEPAPTPVVETPAELAPPAEPEAPVEPSAEPEPAEAETVEPAIAEAAQADQPAEPAPPEPDEAESGKESGEGKATRRAAAKPNVPQRPDVVAPAGPKLETPKAAKLKGPKVIRVEQPDVIRKPQRRRAPGEPMGPGPGEADLIRSRGPVRGRGAGAAGGGRPAEDESSRARRSKRNVRRGRSGAAEVIGRSKFTEQDLAEREERLSRSGGFLKQRRRDMKKRSEGGSAAATPIQTGGKVAIAEPFTIKDLSAATGIKAADIVKFLFNKGVMVTVNHSIDTEAAMEVCLEYGIDLDVKQAQTAEQAVEAEIGQREATDVRRRPPVVTILGHVDHGKTSLLDKIREADVVSDEAGGITQHIGAYRAIIRGTDGQDRTVVFLDTPGHEAFTNMRARGATLTDIVVLVVAADDGVMPQTLESINHAKAAGVPIVVALNKVDKPEATDANIQRILGQLAEQELNPVEWGGTTEVVRTSAETGDGISDLVEILDYQAELLELTADYAGGAYGNVIEAELGEGRGAVARVLVREGQLRIGDFIVMGRAFGRVRDMLDDRGRNLEEAGPATPLEISGIDQVPDAGDKFYVTDSLKKAEDIAEQRRDLDRKQDLAAKSKVSLDNVFEQMQAGETKELRCVVKADVQGSVEVLRKTLEDVARDNEEVSVRVLHAAVGGITESDVLLAEASDAVVIGFQVIASPHARTEAERRSVDIRLYRVIYDVLDDVTNALEGMLNPEQREEVLGHAEVRDVFRVSKVGMVAGCYVTNGVVRRNAMMRVTRDGIVIEHDRTLSSLKRFKEDVREVRSGMECGMSIDGYDDIRQGDVLECYITTEVKQKL